MIWAATFLGSETYLSGNLKKEIAKVYSHLRTQAQIHTNIQKIWKIMYDFFPIQKSGAIGHDMIEMLSKYGNSLLSQETECSE
jgi:hypothetical protein